MLLDTSGLLCLLHKAEPFHSEAVAAYGCAHFRLTQGLVLAEFVALANARGMPRAACLGFVEGLFDSPDIEMLWVDELLYREALMLLQSRLDKTYSLCDAVSFVLMKRRGLKDALTTDRHFDQEGFRRLLG